MSDRSWVNVAVGCGVSEVPAVVRVLLDEYEVAGEVGDLHIEEARIGTAEELAGRLAGVWPEGEFTVSQEPRYEWPGVRVRYSPGGGMRVHNVDGDGDPYVYSATLRTLLAGNAGDPERLVAELSALVDEHLGAQPEQPRRDD